jgi:hypothetical protein
MASGFEAGGTDLDTLFMARVNTKRADVNFDVLGTDISNRYELYTLGTKVATTNYTAGGTDLADLFQNALVPLTVVTVSGELNINDASASRTCRAGIRVNSDGTIDKYLNSTYTQIDSSTDWIIPNGDADSTYDVRITNVVWAFGSSFDVEAAAEDAWIDLGFSREWSIEDSSSGGAGKKRVTFDVQIRKDAGAALDTGTYQCEADYNEL